MLLFSGGQYGEAEIMTMTPDGRACKPRWSPDGTRIVFQRHDPAVGGTRIYIMNSDGSNVRPLTSTNTEELATDWSPDGAKILFLSRRLPRGLSTMYVMDPDGSNVRQLSDDRACPWNVFTPRWSPDGSRIAYTCQTSSGNTVWVMNADGTNAIRINPPPDPQTFTYDAAPTWSPDSRDVAFTSLSDLFVASASGGPAEKLTDVATFGAVGLPGDWGGGR